MIIHIWGHDTPHHDAQAATYEGELSDVANGVLAGIRKHGHDVTVSASTVRGLDGWLREVRAVVDVDGQEQWHVFAAPSDQWPVS